MLALCVARGAGATRVWAAYRQACIDDRCTSGAV